MADRSALKLLKRRSGSDAVVFPEGKTGPDLFSQEECGLFGRQLYCVDSLRTAPARENGFFCCTQIAHPIHKSIWSNQVAPPIPLKNYYRRGARLPAFASSHGEQAYGGVPGSHHLETCAQQSLNENIPQMHKLWNLRCFCHMFYLPLFSTMRAGSGMPLSQKTQAGWAAQKLLLLPQPCADMYQ